MATETADGYSDHVRSVTVTTLASVLGIVAALVSEYVMTASYTSTMHVVVVLAAIAIQVPILKVAGFAIEDFGTKDYLFIAFMTFSLWFVSWTLLLTASAI